MTSINLLSWINRCFFSLQIVGNDISQIVEGQRNLESKYEDVLTQKQKGKSKGAGDLSNVSGELRNSTHTLARSLKQNPLTPDNLEKVQADR